MEIYFLAELQRLDTSFIWSNPTTWDCPIFPGLGFKPDYISIPDHERELQIRERFYGIPIGLLYVTIAHTNHGCAHLDDVYFHKVQAKNECVYELLPH